MERRKSAINYYGFILSADMRCAVHISHLNSVKNHLYYYDTVSVNGEFFCHVTYKVCERTKNFLGIVPNSTSILIKGLMCVAVEFSFAPKRTKVRERVKNFLRECTKFYINFN